jgi:hypothetical protein
MPGTERLDELADELGRISEQMGEAAMDLLRTGLGDGSEAAASLATQRERIVNRARASVDRAVNLLGQAAAVDEASVRPKGPRPARGDPADNEEEGEEEWGTV